jgi:hypothetical protein
LCAHGWGQELAATPPKYDEWVGLMVNQGLQSEDAVRQSLAGCDVAQARAEDPGYRSAAVSLHWPSEAFDDEMTQALPAGPFAPGPGLATSDPAARDALAAQLAAPIPGGKQTQAAIRQITNSAGQIATSRAEAIGLLGGHLPDHLQAAYQALYDASGLAGTVPGATPRPDFGQVVRASVRQAAYASARQSAAQPPASRHGVIGEIEDVIDDLEAAAKVLLAQLRTALQDADAIADKVWGVAVLVLCQLSFWSNEGPCAADRRGLRAPVPQRPPGGIPEPAHPPDGAQLRLRPGLRRSLRPGPGKRGGMCA